MQAQLRAHLQTSLACPGLTAKLRVSYWHPLSSRLIVSSPAQLYKSWLRLAVSWDEGVMQLTPAGVS